MDKIPIQRGTVVRVVLEHSLGNVKVDGKNQEVFFFLDARRGVEVGEDGNPAFAGKKTTKLIAEPKIGDRVVFTTTNDSQGRLRIKNYCPELLWDSLIPVTGAENASR